jgi:hypothetical protein
MVITTVTVRMGWVLEIYTFILCRGFCFVKNIIVYYVMQHISLVASLVEIRDKMRTHHPQKYDLPIFSFVLFRWLSRAFCDICFVCCVLAHRLNIFGLIPCPMVRLIFVGTNAYIQVPI